MKELTVTEMRQDLYRVMDRLIQDNEPVRVRRGKVTVELTARLLPRTAGELTSAERWDRMVALGPRPDACDYKEADIYRTDHWEWDPDKKFGDL